MITGNAKNTVVFFEPYSTDSNPVINVPNIEPKLLIEPIHDKSSFVNGPDTSGVLFDRRIGKAGDKNPILQPCDTIM